MSTVISEVVLAAVCFYCASILWRFNPIQDRSWGAVAALITGVAASLGAIKYGTDLPVDDWHRFAVNIAQHVGMPLLALAWVFATWHWPRASGGRLLLVVVVIGIFVCDRWLYSVPQYSELVGPVSVGLVALAALRALLSHREYSLLGLVGVGLFAMASLVMDTKGSINGILAADLFHYLLAGGWVTLSVSLRHID